MAGPDFPVEVLDALFLVELNEASEGRTDRDLYELGDSLNYRIVDGWTSVALERGLIEGARRGYEPRWYITDRGRAHLASIPPLEGRYERD